jgi:hypothetical protein
MSVDMFDLKAKLLEKGLVTKEQVKQASLDSLKINSSEIVSKERIKAKKLLKSQSTNEQYATIRKWVDNNRLDKPSQIAIDDEKFFFEAQKHMTWLSLPKTTADEIKAGRAGIIAYMSNHGLVHAVVPRDIAEDVIEVFPEWHRVLHEQE